MIKAFYFVFVLFISFACQQPTSGTIDANKLKELQSSGVPIVDIRTPEEYNSGHIAGAILIDFRSPDFLQKMNEFEKNEPLVIHCASGGRSGKAFSLLENAGFVEVYDYSGGFSDWKRKGEEIEK